MLISGCCFSNWELISQLIPNEKLLDAYNLTWMLAQRVQRVEESWMHCNHNWQRNVGFIAADILLVSYFILNPKTLNDASHFKDLEFSFQPKSLNEGVGHMKRPLEARRSPVLKTQINISLIHISHDLYEKETPKIIKLDLLTLICLCRISLVMLAAVMASPQSRKQVSGLTAHTASTSVSCDQTVIRHSQQRDKL